MTDAILLLGPTASGKTPLGDLLQRRGLWGRPCAHFDFGAELRAAAARSSLGADLAGADLALIRSVLQAGRLLDDHEFHIARGILRQFLADRHADAATLVILNGLPRHAGQAEAMADLLGVLAVVELSCDAETVLERIRTDPAGDRAQRNDDHLDAVRRRLVIYGQRTAPLVDYYRRRGTRILTLDVSPTTRPQQLVAQLDALGGSSGV